MPDELLNGAPAEVQGAPDSTPAAPASPPPPDFRQRFEAAGYNLEGYDDDKLFDAIQHGLTRSARADELEPLVAQSQRYLQHAAEIDEFLASKERERQAVQPAPAEKPSRWKVPVEKYDPNWEQYTRFDPQLQRWVLTDEARQNYIAPTLAEQVNTYKKWQTDNAKHITQNFPDAVKEAVADVIAELRGEFDQRLTGYTEEMRNMAEATKFLRDHKEEFFHLDATGNPLVDQTGAEAFKPKGRVFDFYINRANEMGISKQGERIEYAMAMTEKTMREAESREKSAAKAKPAPAAPAAPAAPELTPEQRNAQAKESFVRRAVRGSRVANLATPSPEADAEALKNRRGSAKPNFHEIRKAVAAQHN